MVRGDDAMVVPGLRVDSEGALPSTVQRGGSAGSSLERVSAGKFACHQCNSALTFIAFAQGAECSWCNVRFCSADCRHKHEERCARKLGAHARALAGVVGNDVLPPLADAPASRETEDELRWFQRYCEASVARSGAASADAMPRVSKFWRILPSAVRAATRHGWFCAEGFAVRCAIAGVGME